jgi:hypothetical protein
MRVVFKTARLNLLYFHCYTHSFNLAVGDTLKCVQVMHMSDVLVQDHLWDNMQAIEVFPHTWCELSNLKEAMSPGVPGLCSFHPTRWTVVVLHWKASDWTMRPCNLPGMKQSLTYTTWLPMKLRSRPISMVLQLSWYNADFQLLVWSHVGWMHSQTHQQYESYS